MIPVAPFYSMYNIGPYTLSPLKVVWKRMALSLEAAVVSLESDKWIRDKPQVPQETITFVPLDNEGEAHYLCSLLNSCPANLTAKAYSVGKSFGSPHILEYIRIPKYDSTNTLHRELAALSQRAHELAARNEKEKLREVEEEIDEKAAELWGLTGEELAEIKRSLAELA